MFGAIAQQYPTERGRSGAGIWRGGGRRQGRLLLAMILCSLSGVCALVGLRDALQVTCTPLLRV